MLADPKEGPKSTDYAFPDDAESFPREDVLNHRLHCVLARGDIREGLLLALGSSPPDEFKNQSKIQVTFGILDQWDQEHPAKLELTLNRLPPRAKPMITSTRGPLLSRRDILPQTHPLVAPRDPTAETRKKDAAADRRTPKNAVRVQYQHKRAKTPADSRTRAH